jgi:hypothetical protein
LGSLVVRFEGGLVFSLISVLRLNFSLQAEAYCVTLLAVRQNQWLYKTGPIPGQRDRNSLIFCD